MELSRASFGRNARAEQLIRAVRSGSYRPDAMRIAAAIIDHGALADARPTRATLRRSRSS